MIKNYKWNPRLAGFNIIENVGIEFLFFMYLWLGALDLTDSIEQIKTKNNKLDCVQGKLASDGQIQASFYVAVWKMLFLTCDVKKLHYKISCLIASKYDQWYIYLRCQRLERIRKFMRVPPPNYDTQYSIIYIYIITKSWSVTFIVAELLLRHLIATSFATQLLFIIYSYFFLQYI